MVHVYLEQGPSLKCDTNIQSLSWMGKVPDMLPNEDGLKLDKDLYYQEGWLATGNVKGVVGVTFTTCHCWKNYESPARTNYNLGGHRCEVIMVRWNEPYQKLATCDANGVIFVWIRHEGRWSVELINDRHNQVTDFNWSHDGRMAVICYQDGFVLVGSVGGQRYWSSMLNLDNTQITAGVWTPDDTKILLGTSHGQIVVMGSTGAMITQVNLLDGMEISAMAWSCGKFNMEDREENKENGERSRSPIEDVYKTHKLAVTFKYGVIFLMSNYDDLSYTTVHTGLTGLKMEWSNDGDLLAVGGFVRQPNLQCDNLVKIFCKDGNLKKVIAIKNQPKPLLALTWGHSDRRLYMSAGCNIYIAWVIKTIPSLQMLCRHAVRDTLKDENHINRLPLPIKVRQCVGEIFSPTVKGIIPDLQKLREFVIVPPLNGDRFYCTMIRHDDDTNGDYYTLYLEHLGGLIPILKAKKSSKLRPEFIVFDPKTNPTPAEAEDFAGSSSELSSFDSDSEVMDVGCSSPKARRKLKNKKRKGDQCESCGSRKVIDETKHLVDGLPERYTLIEVSSNIWGTKFRVIGRASFLPRDLGYIVYKTSLLHLQPRQMTIGITELRNDVYTGVNNLDFSGSACSEEEAEDIGAPTLEQCLMAGRENMVPIVPEATVAQAQFSTISPGASLFNKLYIQQATTTTTGLVFQTGIDKEIQCNMKEIESSDSDQLRTSINLVNNDNIVNNVSPNTTVLKHNGTSMEKMSEGFNLDKSKGAIPKIQSKSLLSREADTQESAHESHIDLHGKKEHSQIDEICLNCQSQNGKKICGDACMCGANGSLRSEYESVSKMCDFNIYENLHKNLKFIDDEDSDEEQHAVGRMKKPILLLKGVTTEESVETGLTHQKQNLDKHFGKTETAAKELNEKIEKCKLTKKTKIDVIDKKIKHGPAAKEDKNMKSSPSRFAKQGSVGTIESSPGIKNKTNFSISETDSIPTSNSFPSSPARPELPARSRSLSGHDRVISLQNIESSDDEILLSGDEFNNSHNYKNLESFQKAQLRQKMRKGRSKSDSGKLMNRRQFMMHNKAPLWNENSQVYQLDFGGRVTQESAKNFQIDFKGKQVMQFGRIDINSYTLDFQYPFSAIQAFAVALANVTQRLK